MRVRQKRTCVGGRRRDSLKVLSTAEGKHLVHTEGITGTRGDSRECGQSEGFATFPSMKPRATHLTPRNTAHKIV
jgi:hypothetical protein